MRPSIHHQHSDTLTMKGSTRGKRYVSSGLAGKRARALPCLRAPGTRLAVSATLDFQSEVALFISPLPPPATYGCQAKRISQIDCRDESTWYCNVSTVLLLFPPLFNLMRPLATRQEVNLFITLFHFTCAWVLPLFAVHFFLISPKRTYSRCACAQVLCRQCHHQCRGKKSDSVCHDSC